MISDFVQVADAEAIVQSFKIFTFLKAQSKPMTEEEIARAKDPHLAQPDWVVEAGELPPVIDKRWAGTFEFDAFFYVSS